MPDLNTVLDQHVTLVYESVDRVFLNGYVAKLQEPGQLAWFLGPHRAEALPRYELLGKMTRDFVAAIERYARDRNIRASARRSSPSPTSPKPRCWAARGWSWSASPRRRPTSSGLRAGNRLSCR